MTSLICSPNGGGLGIKYENNSSQDILMSEKEVLMRIRVRSHPLLEDDCTRIKPGDRVVCQNAEKGFFDAEIEKVYFLKLQFLFPNYIYHNPIIYIINRC